MKAKQKVILSVGLVLGGVAMAQGVSALTYQSEVLEEFTWGSTLGLTVSDDAITVSNLVPGQSKRSDADLTVTVNTSNVAGYVLSASVGSATNDWTDLRLGGNDSDNKFQVVAANTTIGSMPAGRWGYTTGTGDNATYSALTRGDTPIDSNNGSGSKDTTFAIGASATTSQATGDYTNVINFKAVSNVVVSSVAMATTSGITGITVNGSNYTAAGTYAPGTVLNIAATPNESTPGNACYWTISDPYGTIADPNSCSTTYTVGNGNVTLTAHHQATYEVTIARGAGISSITVTPYGETATTVTGASSAAYYPEGTVLTLVATPATGYTFSSWSTPATGTIGDTSGATVRYVVGAGAATITATGVPE